MAASRDRLRWCPARGFAIAFRMTDASPLGKLRAMAALVAAYALALQAVFATLAPMQVRADGTLAVYCSVSANAVAPDADDPAGPRAKGKLQCVFCGACGPAAVLLPGAVTPAYLTVAQPIAPDVERSRGRQAESPARNGFARAPPLTV
jgi:hypothetical protein